MKLQNLLCDEITSEFEELSKLQVGTDEYKAAVDGITKLVDRAVEIEKLNNELDAKEIEREFDQDLKLKQIDEDRKDRRAKNTIAVAGIVIPVVVTVWGTIKTLKFEIDGTVTTMAGRNFINKLFARK